MNHNRWTLSVFYWNCPSSSTARSWLTATSARRCRSPRSADSNDAVSYRHRLANNGGSSGQLSVRRTCRSADLCYLAILRDRFRPLGPLDRVCPGRPVGPHCPAAHPRRPADRRPNWADDCGGRRRVVERLAVAAGLTGAWSGHSLRRGFATAARAAGHDPLEIARTRGLGRRLPHACTPSTGLPNRPCAGGGIVDRNGDARVLFRTNRRELTSTVAVRAPPSGSAGRGNPRKR